MSLRRKSRELALQWLFQTEFSPDKKIETISLPEELSAPEVIQYAKELLDGVQTHKESIDSLIQACSTNWKLQRMAIIDRNILRLAIFELSFSNGAVPEKTVMNEAIEIAKKFGTQDSRSFVNGILDQVAKNHKSQQT